eukprot:TRINITY_DN13549_c0_g1_i2.p1 TRINITY_DN13549_c0_g1~~TRINITY_DN13549_c0_g1_i2.p1  ORF type:complete len:651 (-),score=98.61 TRINITY_DN13549_c0_g1_i2:317-2203(-)
MALRGVLLKPQLESYPFYVLPAATFFTMKGLVIHHKLLDEGLLRQPSVQGTVVAVSHQWLSFEEPDPNNEHYSCLKRVLERLMAREVTKVEEYWLETLYWGNGPKSLCFKDALFDLCLWIDYCCIPQARSNDNRAERLQAVRAVESIPSYFERCSILLVLAPLCMHRDTKLACNYASWRSRGWCRLELMCATLSPRRVRALVCDGPESDPYFISFCDIARLQPPQGHFSCCDLGHKFNGCTLPCDRAKVGHVMGAFMHALVEHRLAEGRRMEAFYWKSVKHYYIGQCIPSNDLQSLQAKPTNSLVCKKPKSDGDVIDALKSWLEWDAADDAAAVTTGFTLMMLACLSKNAPAVKALANAGHDANARLRIRLNGVDKLPVCICKGLTPIFAAMLFGDSATIEAVLDARADPEVSVGKKFSPLLYALARGNCQNVCVWLEKFPDWPLNRPDGLGTSGIHIACILPSYMQNSTAGTLRTLVEAGAAHDAGKGWGGPGGALVLAALNEDSDLEVLKYLVQELGHDVNKQWRSHCMSMFLALKVFRQAARCSKSRFMNTLAVFEGAVSLHFAGLRGDLKMINFLLQARADVNIRNAQGRTPLEVAGAHHGCGLPIELEEALTECPAKEVAPRC